MAKARTSPSTKAAHRSKTCKRAKIAFTTKRGKKIEFMGKAGKSCGPRPKPKAPPMRYRKHFAAQARSCAGSSRAGFLKCMKRLRGTMA